MHVLYQILAFNKKFLNLTFSYFPYFLKKFEFFIILGTFLNNLAFCSVIILQKIKWLSLLDIIYFLYLIRWLIHLSCKSFLYFRSWVFFNLISKYFSKDLKLFIIFLQFILSLLDQLILIRLLNKLGVLPLILRCRVITRY